MFKSRLFIKYFFTIVVILAAFTATIYFYSESFIEKEVFEIEKSSARTVLDNVYEMVRSINHDLQSYRVSALQAKKRELKNVIMMAESYINTMDEQSGSVSRGDIEKKILDTISRFEYGNSDYTFVFNNAKVLAHPDPTLVGRDCSGITDVTGKLVLTPMVDAALKDGEGYHTYKWKRLNTDAEPKDKLTYFKYLPKHKWIIATGVYMDDIDNTARKMMSTAINSLGEILRAIKVAKTGYVFIFSPKRDNDTASMVIHPRNDMKIVDMDVYVNTPAKRNVYKELAKAADNPEGIRYKWDKIEDQGHYVYDKITWVRYYKPLGWYICASVYMDELQSSSREMGRRILAIAFAGLIFLIFFGYLFSRRMVAPLKRLSEMALRIKSGDLTATIDIKRNDEIGILADAFNSMVEQLRGNFALLDAKVKERTTELQAAYDKLKALDELKSAFLSNVSHELRTPLTSIYGFAEIIKESFEKTVLPHVNIEGKKVERSVRNINENIAIIISESERLTSLINNLLDLTKMEAGKMVWKKDIINVQDLLNHAVRVTSSLFQRKDSSALIIESEKNIPDTVGDYDRILQVVINLISNAIKFSTDGDITLRADCRSGGHLTVSVSDKGAGIPIEEQEMVFEKFKQLGDTLTNKPTGTGLGLPICKEIVEHHGGRIWVSSAQGQGSIFSFTLPVIRTGQD
ncbi:cache domain-containing protein [Candidatus Magnetominusculus dajiuhuensis]|uniref:cache domain-containing protein n=1 Tax=Candidatus Magnetominusculus dajiuhuensis TaxID=3137712 RepID=UPI003B4298B7